MITLWLVSDPKSFFRKQLTVGPSVSDLPAGGATADLLFRTQLQSSGSIGSVEQVDSPRNVMDTSNTSQMSDDQSVNVVLQEPRVCI